MRITETEAFRLLDAMAFALAAGAGKPEIDEDVKNVTMKLFKIFCDVNEIDEVEEGA